MEGLLDYTPARHPHAGGRHRPLCLRVHPRHRHAAARRGCSCASCPSCCTAAARRPGVPVRAQLLGSDPACLAENAARLAALGPAGIDLNFGCPAKAVNRHRGGAVLLDEPELIAPHRRRRAPRGAGRTCRCRPRCGWAISDDARALECAHAIAGSGADELVVHARTKAAWLPPAGLLGTHRATSARRWPFRWWPTARSGPRTMRARCREVSGCDALMLGRGMVADPGLALAICGGDGAVDARRGLAGLSAALGAEFWRL